MAIQTKEKVKKVAELWITDETLKDNFPKNCVINCKVIEMKLDPAFPILLKPDGDIHYKVYSIDKNTYKETLQKIARKGVKNADSKKN